MKSPRPHKFEIVLERYKFISLKSVSCLQCRWHLTMNGAWPCQLSHACLLAPYSNWLSSLSYIFTSAHQIRSWSWAKFDVETRKNNLALSQTCWWWVHPKTEVQKSKIKHVDQHSFFSFQIKKGIFSADLSTPWQVTIINNTIVLEGVLVRLSLWVQHIYWSATIQTAQFLPNIICNNIKIPTTKSHCGGLIVTILHILEQ